MSDSAVPRGRIWYLEWLRLFACLAVVLIHCFTTLLDNATVAEVGVPRALGWTELLVILCRWAVPVFLMITGALLLDPTREVGWPKVRVYFLRIAAVLLAFGTVFALMELAFETKSFIPAMIPTSLMSVLQGRSWAHLWYLYDLLGIYLLLPLLRSFAASAGRRDLERMLLVLFLFALVVPTVNSALGLSLDTLVWLGSSVFYVLLGWYLRSCDVPVVPACALGAAGTIAAAGIAALGILSSGLYLSWAWSPSSPLVAAQAVAVFLIAKSRADVPMRPGGLPATVASLSFALYVVHPVFANLLYKVLGWASAPLPPLVFELATFAGVLLPSLALAALAKRLPVIGRCL